MSYLEVSHTMERNRLLTKLVWLSILPAPLLSHAQSAQIASSTPQYQLINLGTLGGNESTLGFSAHVLNNSGMFGGQADTGIADPYFPNFNPVLYPFAKTQLQHATFWNGTNLLDLGSLPGDQNSGVSWINELGHAVGDSEDGSVDPDFFGLLGLQGVLWKDGSLIPLGNLGGRQTIAVSLNNLDQIAGFATNSTPDQFSFAGTTQTRAFIWQNGTMTDLGTLGGSDALAGYINDHGQIAGFSYTNSSANPTTGIPTLHAFLWQNGRMLDLPTAGGTLANVTGLNNRGQVIGDSTTSGDVEDHAALWEHGEIIDLGTLGGTFSSGNWINVDGDVVGGSNLPGDVIHHGFLWRRGKLIDLGVVPGDKCSTAWSVNNKGQIVGASGLCGVAVHATLWQHGQIIDLNQLIPPGVQLTYAVDINDAGEIACLGRVTSNEEHDLRVFLLAPKHENDATQTTPSVVANQPTTAQTDARKRVLSGLLRHPTD
jgi:probable HAF family extracellular repeat protein